MVVQHALAIATQAGRQATGTRSPGDATLDPTRIAGITGTLLLNATAMMLMLAPLAAPAPVSAPDMQRDTDTVLVDLRPPTPATDPPPPRVLPVVPRTTTATPRAVERSLPVRTADPAPSFDAAELPPEPVQAAWADTAPAAAAVAPATAASIGASLEYIRAPAPAYPRQALLEGREGTVLLRVTVGIDGRPTSVEIERSSGDRELDNAARRQVLRQWRFQPAMREGRPVDAIGLVPVAFTLG